jgi:hypothetical protein
MAGLPGILRKWNPGIIPGLTMWIDGEDSSSLTVTGSNISQISDKSGFNILLSQNTTSNQPARSSNINGRQTIEMHAGDFISTTRSNFAASYNNPASLSQFTVFSLYNTTVNSVITGFYDTNIAVTGPTSNYTLSYRGTTTPANLIITKSGTNNLGTDTLVANTPYFVENFRDNNNNIIALYNENLNSYNQAPDNNIMSNLRTFALGRGKILNLPVTGMYGDIGEVLFYNTSYLSNRAYLPQLEGYFAWKWGMQTILSNDHPYKLRPPT